MRVLLVLVMVLCAAPARAVTIDDLAAIWSARLAGFGITPEVGQVTAGAGSKDLAGVVLDLGLYGPNDDLRASLILQKITLTEQPDGTVAVAFPDDVWLELEGPEAAISLNVTSVAPRLTIGHTANGLNYAYAAQSLTIAGKSSKEDPLADDAGVLLPRASLALGLSFEELDVVWVDLPGPLAETQFTLSARASFLDFVERFPQSGIERRESMTQTAPLLRLRLVRPVHALRSWPILPGDLKTALRAGLNLRIDSSDRGSTQTTAVSGKPEHNEGLATEVSHVVTQGARAWLSLGKQGAEVGLSGQGLAMTGPVMPITGLPLDITARIYGISAAMPFEGGSGPYSLGLLLEGVALSDEIWQAVDPQGHLARDEMGMDLDLQAASDLGLADILSALDEGRPVPPLLPSGIDLRRLGLQGLGAALAMSGKAGLTYRDGMPVPDGTAEVTLEGGYGLLEARAGAGPIRPEDATAARMVLAAGFDKVEGTEDRLTSRIDARPDGSVYVNGARMR